MDEAEKTIQDYLEQCNQEGSSFHHHQRRASSLSEPTSICDGDGVEGGVESSQEAPVSAAGSGLALIDGVTTYSSPQFPSVDSTPTQPPGNGAKTTSTPVVGKKHNYMRPFKCSDCGKRSNWSVFPFRTFSQVTQTLQYLLGSVIDWCMD